MLVLPTGLVNRIFKSLRAYNKAAEGINIENYTICREDGSGIDVHLLYPEMKEGKLPCLVYYHGGGFQIGIPPNLFRRLSRYVLEAGCAVVSPDYRLAGEAPFPAGFHDAYDVLLWTADNCQMLGIDPDRLAVGGDSSGANLAAATALAARDSHGPGICFQMLLYPTLDYKMKSKSMALFDRTLLWNSKKNKRVWDVYLRDGAHGMHAYASPLYAESFAGLPDAYIEIAERDCLRDEAILYGRELEKAGVDIEMRMLGNAHHGYDNLQGYGPVKKLVDKRILALKRALAGDDDA